VAFSQEKIMQVISARTVQQNWDTICEQIYQNHEPYIVNQENHHNVVILSLDDYNSWTETNYFLVPMLACSFMYNDECLCLGNQK
jgi:PHD/YefM family antitoxin component YafN of YafNO toxin-antitoxin module